MNGIATNSPKGEDKGEGFIVGETDSRMIDQREGLFKSSKLFKQIQSIA
jgi:hypothetical protein